MNKGPATVKAQCTVHRWLVSCQTIKKLHLYVGEGRVILSWEARRQWNIKTPSSWYIVLYPPRDWSSLLVEESEAMMPSSSLLGFKVLTTAETLGEIIEGVHHVSMSESFATQWPYDSNGWLLFTYLTHVIPWDRLSHKIWCRALPQIHETFSQQFSSNRLPWIPAVRC